MNTLLLRLTSLEWALIVKALLHSLWQGALIAGALALLLRRVGNPAARHRFALAGLGGVMVATLVTWGVLNAPRAPTLATVPAPVPGTSVPPAATGPVQRIVVAANWKPAEPQAQWTAWLALVWLLGASLMLGRASVKVAGAEQLRRSCRPLNDPRIAELVAGARRAVKLTRQIRVAVTNQLTSPAVVGVLVPTLILPLSLITTLTAEQLRFVLLHELAHIRRGDYLANLFQLFVEALLFFNPAAWWISHQIRREREACCDALAVELSGAPGDYARTLVSVAETILIPSPAAAPAFGNKRESSSLADRVQRVLVPGYRPALRLTWRAMIAALLAGSGLLILLAAGTRQTVAATAALLATNSYSPNPPAEPSTSAAERIAAPPMSLSPGSGLSRGYKMEGLTVIVHEDGRYWYRSANVDLEGLRARLVEWTNVVLNSQFVVLAHTNAPAQSVSNVVKMIEEFGTTADVRPFTPPAFTESDLHTRTFKVSAPDLARAMGNVGPVAATNTTELAREFFARIGVDLQLPGRTAFFTEFGQLLFVRATRLELEKVEAFFAAPIGPKQSTNNPPSALPSGARRDQPVLVNPIATTNAFVANTNLFTRTFVVDPGAFVRGLERVGGKWKTNITESMRNFFAGRGVDLRPPNVFFFNERQGTLIVRGLLSDLDIVERALEELDVKPPLVNIRAKFVEVPADKNGVFLGKLRLAGSNSVAATPPGGQVVLQTSNSFTWVLTASHTEAVFKALERTAGVEVLTTPSVTALSGRQEQIQVVDTNTIVPDVVSPFIHVHDASTNVVSRSDLPFGPVIDLIPRVSTDGHTVEMTVIPTVTEFLGYEDPGQFVPQVGSGGSRRLLPCFRVRQVATASPITVWDGQTIVIGGFSAELVTQHPDGSKTQKPEPKGETKQRFLFLTPTIVDAAGNRVHTDEQLPFAPDVVPKQKLGN